jgi:hypothetical protein
MENLAPKSAVLLLDSALLKREENWASVLPSDKDFDETSDWLQRAHYFA